MRVCSFHYILLHPLQIVPAVFVLKLPLCVHADDFLDGILDGLFGTKAGCQQSVRVDAVAARVVGGGEDDVRVDMLRNHIGNFQNRDVLEAGVVNTGVLGVIEQEQVKVGNVV